MLLVMGALLGLIAVAFDAFSVHSLKATMTNAYFEFLMTAIRYNQIGAVLVSIMGFVLLSGGKSTIL